MKTYMSDFFELYSYPDEARQQLLQAYLRIESDINVQAAFEKLLKYYETDIHFDFEYMLTQMADLSQKANIHVYTGHLLLLICLSSILKKYYQTANIDEKIWITSMNDLKWKMDECICVYGIYGTFVPSWFAGFFKMTRFGFTKLQFEPVMFKTDYKKDNIILKPNDTVINVHIPRTGTRLDRESLQKSYQEAITFFQKDFKGKPFVFVCNSWLLFPRNKEILSPQSNLFAFISDFDIIKHGTYDDYSEVWRLFDKNYEGDPEQLPSDTSFRRGYINWIRKGEKIGWGYGIRIT